MPAMGQGIQAQEGTDPMHEVPKLEPCHMGMH